jgi:hypothetical protein
VIHPSGLFSDAEGSENEIKDVVGGGCAGDFIEGAQGVVEVEQQHFVRHSGGNRVRGGVQGGKRIADKLLMADAGKKPAFQLGCRVAADARQDS